MKDNAESVLWVKAVKSLNSDNIEEFRSFNKKGGDIDFIDEVRKNSHDLSSPALLIFVFYLGKQNGFMLRLWERIYQRFERAFATWREPETSTNIFTDEGLLNINTK